MELTPSVENILIAPTEAHYLHYTLEMLRSAETGAPVTAFSAPNDDTVRSTSLTLTTIRRDVCRQAHRLYNQIGTLRDWNRFLSNVI